MDTGPVSGPEEDGRDLSESGTHGDQTLETWAAFSCHPNKPSHQTSSSLSDSLNAFLTTHKDPTSTGSRRLSRKWAGLGTRGAPGGGGRLGTRKRSPGEQKVSYTGEKGGIAGEPRVWSLKDVGPTPSAPTGPSAKDQLLTLPCQRHVSDGCTEQIIGVAKQA